MEVVMRGIDTPVRKMRREIFKEIAQLAYHSDNLNDDVEALPYKIVNPETPIYRESIYREREIVREQIRLAMGLSLRPEDAPVHVTQGLEESNIDEKYYEPPMIQVIPSACNACPENEYCVTDRCMGCVAHPCQVVCPRGAISTVMASRSLIRANVFAAVNVNQCVPTMQFPISRDPAAQPAVWVRSAAMGPAGRLSTARSVSPVASVW